MSLKEDFLQAIQTGNLALFDDTLGSLDPDLIGQEGLDHHSEMTDFIGPIENLLERYNQFPNIQLLERIVQQNAAIHNRMNFPLNEVLMTLNRDDLNDIMAEARGSGANNLASVISNNLLERDSEGHRAYEEMVNAENRDLFHAARDAAPPPSLMDIIMPPPASSCRA